MTSFVLQTTEEFRHDLDFEPLNEMLVESIPSMKAKDIIRMLQLHRGKPIPKDLFQIDQSVGVWLLANFKALMPEEVVLAL